MSIPHFKDHSCKGPLCLCSLYRKNEPYQSILIHTNSLFNIRKKPLEPFFLGLDYPARNYCWGSGFSLNLGYVAGLVDPAACPRDGLSSACSTVASRCHIIFQHDISSHFRARHWGSVKGVFYSNLIWQPCPSSPPPVSCYSMHTSERSFSPFLLFSFSLFPLMHRKGVTLEQSVWM